MKVLIVHQYFNTPETGGPLRSYYLACGLKSNGYEVEIITAHNHKNTEIKEIEGFKVHYLPVFYDNSLSFVVRVMAFVKFAWLAYRRALGVDAVDFCYAISTPLTVGWIAKKLKATRGTPFVFEVGDLWPEAPIQMGVVKWHWIINKVRQFEKSIYQQADKVVALSPGIRESILKCSPGSQVAVIPNMSDCQFYQMESKDKEQEAKLGVAGKLVVTYFGAAGRANHLEYLLEAARKAKVFNTDLHFLVVAHGSELSRIKKLSAQYRLDNLDFLSYRNRNELKKVLNVTDAVYVSYADVPILATGSPNKYFDGLAAGKLMLLNFKGWLKEITEQHGLGFYVDPDIPEMLSEVLEPAIFNQENLVKLQSNARLIAETFFSRGLAIQKLLRFLDHEQQVVIKEPEVYTLTA